MSAEPTPLFRDSPTWALDRTAVAYIKSCQGSSPGDSVDPAYLLRLPASAIVAEAQAAFAENKPAEAYRLFREAQPLADADDLRILNGLYLSGWRTGKKKEATETFGRIVGIGLDSKKLPIKIFFNPGQTTLLASADLQAQYAVWLREVALQVGVRETCMKVVGHTSRTGTAAANLALSQRRASLVKQTLERLNKSLDTRIIERGRRREGDHRRPRHRRHARCPRSAGRVPHRRLQLGRSPQPSRRERLVAAGRLRLRCGPMRAIGVLSQPRGALAALALGLLLAGCGSAPKPAPDRPSSPRPAPSSDRDGVGTDVPPDLASLPDAEPRIEPIRAGRRQQALHRARPRLRADHPRQRLQASAAWRRGTARSSTAGAPPTARPTTCTR